MRLHSRVNVRRTFLPFILFALSLGLTLLPSHSAHADGEGLQFLNGGVPSFTSIDTPGVRALGMGSSGLALSDGPEAFFLNPAGLSFMNYSYAEGGFYIHPNADNRVFNISVADGKTNPFVAGGMSYSHYIAARPDDGKFPSVFGHIVRLGTAVNYKKIIAFGVNLKYIHLDRPFNPPLSGVNLDVGITWQIIPGLRLSAVGYNLIYNDSFETPIALGVGLAFAGLRNLPLRISVDWVMDFQTRQKLAGEFGHELRVGASYTFVDMITIRLGYHWDHTRDKHMIGAGLGFKYKNVGLEAAFRQQLITGDMAYDHFFGFTAVLYF